MFKTFQLFVFVPVTLFFLVPMITHANLGPGLDKGSLTVPDSYLSDWTKAGVEGGIPDTSNATLWPVINTDTDTVGGCTPFTTAEKSDTADDHVKIQCYVDYAGTLSGVGGRRGTVVKLGAGTFRLGITPLHDSSVHMHSNVVLRGSGPSSTTISGEWGANYFTRGVQNFGDWAFIQFAGQSVGTVSAVTDNPISAGATTLTVANASTFAIGDWIILRQTDDPYYITNTPEIPGSAAHIFKVTNKSGNTLTMDRPLRLAFNPAMNPVVFEFVPLQNAGIENFKIMGDENSPDLYAQSVSFQGSANSWVTGMYFYNGNTHHHLSVANSRGIQVESNKFERLLYYVYAPVGDWKWANNYAVSLGTSAEDNLVTNNIFLDSIIQVIIARGASGNVVSYNYITASADPRMSRGILVHGHYPHHNLVEGNDTDQRIAFDDTWGKSGIGLALYRNRLRSDIRTAEPYPEVDGMMQNEGYQGGLLSPEMEQLVAINNSAWAWFATPGCSYAAGCPSYLWDTLNSWIERNTFRDTTTASNRGFVTLQQPASAHVDNVVLANTTPPAWPGFTFPASFYATSKPSWWCDETPWPAIGANLDNFTNNPTNLVKLPAQRRYEGLTCTTSGGTVITPPTNNSPTISLSVTPTSITTGGSVTFSATASDSDGTISNVQFYVNGNFQATDTTYPYSLSYSPTSAGSYAITAIATDNGGATGSSGSVSLTVNPANLCGNNTIDTGEQCDGTNLNGQSCSSLSLGFTGGTLSCSSSCTFNTTSCTTSGGSTLTLGSTIAGTNSASNYSTYVNAARFTTGAQGGTAQSISAYIGSPIGTPPNNQYSLALYSNNGTVPGTLIAQTTNGTITGNAWNTLSITATLQPNTTYWLAHNTNGTANNQNNLRYSTGGTSDQDVWSAQPFGTWPTTFGTIAGSSGATMSIYLTYTTGSTASNLQNLSFSFSTDTNLSLLGKAVTVSILPQESTKTTLALETQTPTASYQGSTNQITLSTTGRTPGSYDIQIKAPSTLSRKQTFTLASNQTFTLTNKLISGDINNDNAINALDWSLMSPDWFQTGRTSDINGDGITNALDFTWLNRNWFLIGE